ASTASASVASPVARWRAYTDLNSAIRPALAASLPALGSPSALKWTYRMPSRVSRSASAFLEKPFSERGVLPERPPAPVREQQAMSRRIDRCQCPHSQAYRRRPCHFSPCNLYHSRRDVNNPFRGSSFQGFDLLRPDQG